MNVEIVEGNAIKGVLGWVHEIYPFHYCLNSDEVTILDPIPMPYKDVELFQQMELTVKLKMNKERVRIVSGYYQH